MSTSAEKIVEQARKLLTSAPDGIRWSKLLGQIDILLPDIPRNTIHGALHKFTKNLPENFYQPSRGLYRHVKYQMQDDSPESLPPRAASRGIREEAFYAPFADWLENEVEECTKAIPLGGSIFKDKWGTPDVIGVREAARGDPIQPPTEIVTAEIKLDLNGLITAFGQTCSYKLFSHRAYLVVPQNSSNEDVSRLDALARIFGIGLVLFDASNPEVPNFSIRVRASRHEPDMFYVNKNMKLVAKKLF